MLDKLEHIVEKFNDLTESLSDPDIISNMDKFRAIGKERSQLEPIVEKFKEYKKASSDLEEAKEVFDLEDDPELKEMAKEEIDQLMPELEKLSEELKLLLIPKDPNDSKDVYLEIRAGTGGDEAGLFAQDLLRMYQKYAEINKWSFDIADLSETGIGGIKEVVVEIKGDEVFGKLKFESGVHRVQRVPQTETQGRVHTSAATVAVLPEFSTEDITINTKDLKIDTYRASGAGGQHVNKTDSAIRITHLPTNTVVQCQTQRSQHKNKETAMKMLATKLQEVENQKVKESESSARKLLVGTGDRSGKIRTYNYPQGRVTDHRIGLTLYKLDSIMNGDVEDIIEALILADRTERLQQSENE
ncbi:MAG: peptide chain release factor 1 [Candidatus Cloacimonadota bacterium]|nr:MAG: peptide chain release factor 1 [Candidatus Cloacimonadota bacterium]PIE77995.1 MAG: peptide chain release factor 1 [Candidatus Delongbacteria bacterium]